MMHKRKKMTETSEMFSHKSKDQRKFFRVRPSNREPVFIELTGKNIQVCDISAGGIAFKNHKLKAGQDQSIKINLPDRITIESTPSDSQTTGRFLIDPTARIPTLG